MEEDFDRELKVLVIGNGGVGKTSMIRRFAKGIFTDEYKKTIGVDFLEKALFVDALQEEVRFMLWDTAGQDEFDKITRAYYRGAGAAVIAFSTTDRASFDAVSMWKSKLEAECGDIAVALVQNKVDLVDQAAVSPTEVESLARKLGVKLYRACVKEGINVTEVFVYLAELHQRKLESGPAQEDLSQQQQREQIREERERTEQVHQPTTLITADTGEVKDDSRDHQGDMTPSKRRTKGKKSLKDKFKKIFGL